MNQVVGEAARAEHGDTARERPAELQPDGAQGDGAEPGSVMDLLAHQVPPSLLMDLVAPDGPHSSELLDVEGEPEDAWWEQP